MASSISGLHAGPGRVLLVDDDDSVRDVYTRFLKAEQHVVVAASSGEEAVKHLADGRFDCVVSDISMPGMSGIELLRKIREHDLDVPVVLVTGKPAIESALSAIDEGAAKYLVKPCDKKVLTDTVAKCVNLSRLAQLKRHALDQLGGMGKLIGDRAGLTVKFDAALASLHMVFQPICRLSDKSIYGYEALVRTKEPSIPHPGALFDVAERLDRVPQLSRRIREAAALPFAEAPTRGRLFVNLHVLDFLDEALYSPSAPLTRFASRVVLEVTERASLDVVPDVRARIERLRALGFRIAIDDLGAGYAGLNTFAHLEPEVVKLDMSLVRDVHTHPMKQKLVKSMVTLCSEMKLDVVAEGIENADELACLAAIGCDLIQGYFLGRPGAPFVEPKFP